MAARLNPAPSRPPEIVDLRRLTARSLEPLLQEESAAWWDTLEWDFEKSADLVRRFIDLRALNGYALVGDGLAIGYIYYVLEENKGLMGDLYVMREHRTIERENMLLAAALESIATHPRIARIESQLMMLEFSSSRSVPGAGQLSAFDRNFMRIDLRRATLPEGQVRRAVYIDRWNDQHQDAAAHLIAAAYEGHRQPHQRPVPHARRRTPVPPQHRAVSRLRLLLPSGLLLRLRALARTAVRRLALQPGLAGVRPHHADLRLPRRERHGHRLRTAAPIAIGPARLGLPLRHTHCDRGQRRRRRAL
jgi:hypothetical protein